MFKATALTAAVLLAVLVSAPAQAGRDCRFTQGYWQNRAENAGDTTTQIWSKYRSRNFFLSNSTYEDVLRTPVRGSAYYNLAHQYIASEMNILNGAVPPLQVTAAFRASTRVFASYTPVQIEALGKSDPLVRSIIGNAALLDQWNNGLVGTGMCNQMPPGGW